MEFVGDSDGDAFDLFALIEQELACIRKGHQPNVTPGQWVDIFLQLAKGLKKAHQKGVTLLDLRAPNVLLRETGGRVYPVIADFSLAVYNTSGLFY